MRVSCRVNGEERMADDVWPGESLLFDLIKEGHVRLEELLRTVKASPVAARHRTVKQKKR